MIAERGAQAPDLSSRVSPLLVCVAILGAVGLSLGLGALSVVPGIVALLALFAVDWRKLALIGKLLFGLAVLVTIYLLATDRVGWDQLLPGLGRGLALAGFFSVLSILQSAARSSPMIQRAGEAIVSQPPGRRYLVLTFGSSVFGMLLNLGSISLLAGMIRQAIPDAEAADPEARRIHAIRLKRMGVALLRGFSSVPSWSPISVLMVVLTTSIPGVSWTDMISYTLPATLVYLGVGWFLDRMTYTRQQRVAVPGGGRSLRPLIPLAWPALALPGVAFVVASWLSVGLVSGLTIVMPLFALVWIWIQKRALPGPTLPAIGSWGRLTVLPALPTMRTELAIFASSAYLGVIVPEALDTTAISAAIEGMGLGSGVVLALTATVIALAGFAGVNPILGVTLAVGILMHMPELGISNMSLALMGAGSWVIAIGASGFSASIRVMGRAFDCDPMMIALRWNLGFTLMVFATHIALLLIFA